MNINDKNIGEFWIWFKSISSDLLADTTNEKLITQLDNRISELGRFDWEIGPLDNGYSYFAISPNLDINKLEFTRRIIATAPNCNGWRFLFSKPRRIEWKGIWKMKNEKGKDIWIDCSMWKYILYKFEDKTYDIDILVTGVEGDQDTKRLAVEIALTGYLGEEYFMLLLKNFQIIDGLEDSDKNKATLIRDIRSHLESIS